MNPYKPNNPEPENHPVKDSQVQKKQQDDPNQLQQPGGSKEKYVPKPGAKGMDEDNPSRDYDNENESDT